MTDAILPDKATNRSAQAPARRLSQPQAVRAVFCDVGFTLLEPYPSVVEIAWRVCEDAGLAIERACLERQAPAAEAFLRRSVRANPQTWADDRAINAVWAGYYTELLGPCLQQVHAATTLDEVVEKAVLAFDHYTSYALYPDVVPVLRALHARGLTLGVISDWGIGLGSILREHGLNRYFDFAVISAAVRYAKPHPWLFETALKRANAIPDYAIHIGDSYILDVLGARTMGIEAVLIDRPGKLDPAVLDVPVVRDLYGVLDLLEIEREGIDDLGGA